MNDQIGVLPLETLGCLERPEIFRLLIHDSLGAGHSRRSQGSHFDGIPIDLRRAKEAIARTVSRYLSSFRESKCRLTLIEHATAPEIYEQPLATCEIRGDLRRVCCLGASLGFFY